MRSMRLLQAALGLAAALGLSACVSSEEAGTGRSTTGPVRPPSAREAEALAARADSLARLDTLRARRGDFTSRQDTVVAAVVRTRSPGRRIKPIERPANPAYTVQVGAFARTKYALGAQKLAKERFSDLPIFNIYEPYDKLYRIRVGKFDTWAQADSLRRAMIRNHPEEYTDAWVNYIAR